MSSAAGEQKKVFGLPHNVGIGFLCVLGALVLYAFYSNVLAGPSVPTPPDAGKSAAASAPAIPLPGSSGEEAARRPASTQRRNSAEFNPPFRSKRPEDRIKLDDVDPTLRTDLLAKVQAVELAGGARNVFQMGPPPPKAEDLLARNEPTVRPMIGPKRPPDPPPPPAPVVIPEPPIQLKYYGLSTVVRSGKRTGFFMDGDDTPLVAAEGELVKRRYRVIRLTAKSVQVEDTEGKRTVTLPITEETPS